MKTNKYEKEFFTDIVKKSVNITDVAKNLSLKPFCGNRQTIKKYIELYEIDISHFKITYNTKGFIGKKLSEILVENSSSDTTHLKNRLYKEGLKERKCEKCGQGEDWHGEHMSLILDHINGINTDNRLENLRIVCPNCNATLPTHCGKNAKSKFLKVLKRIKLVKHCKCGSKIDNKSNRCVECNSKTQRKIERPLYEQLKQEIKEFGYCGTGRKYGVSDNAIRKWIKFYEK